MKKAVYRQKYRGQGTIDDLGTLYKDKCSYIPSKRFADYEANDPDDESFLNNCINNEVLNTNYNPKLKAPPKEICLRIDSEEFIKFIKDLEERMKTKFVYHHICLSCWQYISNH